MVATARWCWLLFACLACSGGSGRSPTIRRDVGKVEEAPPASFLVSGDRQSGREPIELLLDQEGRTTIPFLREDPGKEPVTVDLGLRAFASDGDAPLVVEFLSGEGGERVGQSWSTTTSEREFVAYVVAEDPEPGTTYEGSLTMLVPGQASIAWTVRVTRPAEPRPELMVEPPKVETRISSSETLFHLTVCESSGEAGISELSVGLTGESKSPTGTFDLGNHLSRITVDGQEVVPLDLAPGEEVEVELVLEGLPPGDYEFTLAFRSPDLLGSEPVKLPVVIHVKHGVIWAVLLLLGAGLVSFLTTKGIVSLRARARSLRRVWRLRKD